MTKCNVIIGNDVWVGFGSTIMSGVKIGDGAVVSAMAVVTKDVSPYSIVAGNPAREVGKRFDEATIQALVELTWWDWPERAIRESISLLSGDNIDGFIATARKNAY